jgi:hypothetical protein
MTDTLELPIFSPALAEHLQQSPPEFLYHYTSQEGLLGIIKTGSLWATNISYLNDSTEFELSLGLIRDSLSAAIETSEWEENRFTTRDPDRATDATKRKEEESRLWRLATRIDGSDLCVTCFCKEDDLLSQWRGYTGPGYGYSLAFHTERLKTSASDAGFIFGKCIYNSDLQKHIINESLEYLLTKGPAGDRVEIKDFVAVIRYCAFFKHPSFEQEQEWRLVSSSHSDLLQTRFRSGNSMIIPYVLIPIGKGKLSAIDRVRVGPRPHMDLSKRSVELLLVQNDMTPSVYPSFIPFRDW